MTGFGTLPEAGGFGAVPVRDGVSVNDAVRDDGASARSRREAFLKWQCRVRQMATRVAGGRPDAAIRPHIILPDGRDAGVITTVLLKRTAYDVTPEFRHMAMRTHDPAERRDAAVRFLSASHYQKAGEFRDELAATFPPGSEWSSLLLAVGQCRLDFDAYAQRYELCCRIRLHRKGTPFREAAFWHNRLFNPALDPDTDIVGFVVDWGRSSANPDAPCSVSGGSP
ncbi:MAG: hypothetical protein OXI81_12195 [Paracoccaceae bacterium]|nr:hypothetical protein [Paracoccaceae bacterium]